MQSLKYSLPSRIYSILLAVLFVDTGNIAWGQPPANNGTQTVTVQQKVEPTFRIEPVVQRFQASRGQVIPFEFLMTSTGREMEVELKVVELRQEENGTILHKEEGKSQAAVTFSSPQNFTLGAGNSQKITGELTVPTTKSNFHTFGILVRDKGQAPTFQTPENAKAAVQAGIRFVTQYILRCDIEVVGAIENEMGQIKFEEGGFRVQDGLPVARVWIENPTNSAFEFQVRGLIKADATSSRPEVLQMGMASRATLAEPDKYVVRIMPQSRLRLEAPVSTLLTPGQAQLTFAVHNGRREVVSKSFDTQIAAGDFPAVEVTSVRVNDTISVTPGQIALSQQKGGQRTISVHLQNSSEQAQNVQVKLLDFEGNEIKSVQISPETVQLAPKRTQNMRLTLRSSRDAKEAQFGYLHLTTIGTEAKVTATSARVPVAIHYAPVNVPNVEFTPLETVSIQNQTAFKVVATNHETGFTPIHAELVLLNEAGQRVQMTAGYNKWIRPQESHELLFRPEIQIPAGRYQATLNLRTFEGTPAKTFTTEFTLQEKP